ncbi:MAG TPA: phosphoglycerate mutase, partial [Candidatus Hydrogenedentes bacterium]|nr:phosphoglycerate mutase [Candidatus Hydrogenedentota bacterium]
MKYLILIGDGMADFPLAEHGGRTPLELAHTPAMDDVVQRGLTGLYHPIPEACAPGSDIGNLSLFGYDPRVTYTGRAPLEAANQGITLAADEVAFRCNVVTLEDGRMKDFTAGHISSEEAEELIAALNADLGDSSVAFHAGVSYRHLAVVKAGAASATQLMGVACTPPHDITGQTYKAYLPVGAGADIVRDLMARSEPILEHHPVNAARRNAGKSPATAIWLWGQGC